MKYLKLKNWICGAMIAAASYTYANDETPIFIAVENHVDHNRTIGISHQNFNLNGKSIALPVLDLSFFLHDLTVDTNNKVLNHFITGIDLELSEAVNFKIGAQFGTDFWNSHKMPIPGFAIEANSFYEYSNLSLSLNLIPSYVIRISSDAESKDYIVLSPQFGFHGSIEKGFGTDSSQHDQIANGLGLFAGLNVYGNIDGFRVNLSFNTGNLNGDFNGGTRNRNTINASIAYPISDGVEANLGYRYIQSESSMGNITFKQMKAGIRVSLD